MEFLFTNKFLSSVKSLSELGQPTNPRSNPDQYTSSEINVKAVFLLFFFLKEVTPSVSCPLCANQLQVNWD